MTGSSTSLVTSLGVAAGAFRISAGTVWDSLFRRVTRELCDRRLAWWARSAVALTKMDLRIGGQEHIPPNETFVVMSNHQSHYDIPVLFHAVPGTVRMVAKIELFRIPVWGKAMEQSGFIAIDRANRQKAMSSLRAARTAIHSGVNVWIAPEGTRSLTGELLPFKKGGFLLAADTEVRILPVGIAGTKDVLPADGWRTRLRQNVGVAVGEPINVAGKNRNLLLKETREAIAALMQQAEGLRAGPRVAEARQRA